MNKLLLLTLIIFYSLTSNGQFLNNFGMRIGPGVSNQYWDYEESDVVVLDGGGWHKEKIGFSIYLNAEKDLTKYISLRPEIGYIQKGFIYDFSISGEPFSYNLTFHDLSANIGLKIKPIDFVVLPYLIAGIRFDYLLGFTKYEYVDNGNKILIYPPAIDDFNKFTLSGLIGFGIEFSNVVFIEFEFNPAITKNLSDPDYVKLHMPAFDDPGLTIKDMYYGVTIGLHISSLIEKKNNSQLTTAHSSNLGVTGLF